MERARSEHNNNNNRYCQHWFDQSALQRPQATLALLSCFFRILNIVKDERMVSSVACDMVTVISLHANH